MPGVTREKVEKLRERVADVHEHIDMKAAEEIADKDAVSRNVLGKLGK